MDANTIINKDEVIFSLPNGYQIILKCKDGIDEHPFIKVYYINGNESEDCTFEDCTFDIFGMASIYGSISNLTKVYGIMMERRKLF